MKYKYYWRKSGLKRPYGDSFLSLIDEFAPTSVLEVGVFCGVTSRNICEKLNILNNGEFKYFGIDLFGKNKLSNDDEIEPKFLINQNFSNPFKKIYYNYIKRENLNSKNSVEKFLKKFKKNIKLIQGDTRSTLSQVPIEEIDLVFLDGGHSYDTVISDLKHLSLKMKKKSKIICDDFAGVTKIESVEKAINDFVKKENLILEKRFERFALINLDI